MSNCGARYFARALFESSFRENRVSQENVFFRIFVTHTLVLFAEEICCSNVTRPSPRARVARVDQLERFEKLLDSIYYRRLEHFPSLIRTGLLIYESMKHLW